MKTYELSNAQLNILDTEMFYGNTSVNVLSGACLFTADISLADISDAINTLLQNSEGLRTRLRKTADSVVRYVYPYQAESFEHSSYDEQHSVDEMWGALATECAVPMQLWDSKLYNFKLITSPDQRNGYVITAHHMICDAAILYEIAVSLNNIIQGTYVPATPRPLSRSSTSYERMSNRAKAFWMTSAVVKNAPAASMHGIAAKRHTYHLDSTAVVAAEKYAAENEIALSTIIESAYYLSIASALSKDAFNAGIMYMDRYSKDYDGLPGCYAEVLPIPIDTASVQSFTELCQQISTAHMSAYRHSVLPYRDILQCVRNSKLQNSPITNLYDFVYSFQVASKINEAGYSIKWLFNGCSEVPIKLSVTLSVTGFEIIIDQQIGFYNDALSDQIFGNIQHILKNLAVCNDIRQLRANLAKFEAAIDPRKERNLNIAASFTAEPIETFFSHWAHKHGKELAVRFAPYNQILQMLLDSNSLLRSQHDGYNVILFRAVDAIRHAASVIESTPALIADAYQEFLSALREYPTDAPICLVACFDADSCDYPQLEAAISKHNSDIKVLCESKSNLLYLPIDDLCERYAVAEKIDVIADREGHIPYTNEYFAAIATHVWRKIEALTHKKHYKVLVADCDNTLWGGVCGEVGASGVSITGGYAWLQKFLAEKRNEGYLLAIASKNNPEDVKKVFSENSNMVLSENDISAWKVSWGSKTEAIRAIAAELNLGIDSFVFLDDSPVECSAMIAENPDVLTVQIPANDAHIPQLVGNLWCLDTGKATQEDRMRTDMYRAEREREQTKIEGEPVDAYLSRLGIRMYMYSSQENEIERIAQMTQRTNQFNMNGIRYTQSEVASMLSNPAYRCFSIRVEDRFGSYGLVGAIIIDTDHSIIKTFVLSCRVLGRGVEHAVFAVLKEVFYHHNGISAHIIKTDRNEPFLRFVERYLADGITGDSSSIMLDRAETPAYVKVERTAPAIQEPLVTTKQDVYVAKSSALQKAKSFDWNTLCNKQEYIDIAKTSLSNTVCCEVLGTGVISASNELIDVLCDIFSSVLKADSVAEDDNFFALGGDSLKAVAIVSLIERKTGVHISISDLFQYPTVAQMAAHVDKIQPRMHDQLEHIDFAGPYELSSAQLRMFILQAMNPSSVQYNELQVLQIEGNLKTEKLQDSLEKVILRHEILRTGFAIIDGTPKQYLCAFDKPEIVHLETTSEHMRETILGFRQPFDLSKPPFIRMAQLHNTDNNTTYLLLDVHHIIIDGTSFSVLTDELLQLYSGVELPVVKLQYSDYVRWQKQRQDSSEYQQHLMYWLEQYKTPVAPLLLGNEANRTAPISHGKTVFLEINYNQREQLESYTTSRNVTPFAVLFTAYALALHVVSKSDDFAIGIPVANRLHHAWHHMIGNFVNSLPIRISVQKDATIGMFVDDQFRAITNALDHQECAYEQIVEKLRITREPNRNPLFDVMFSLQNMVPDTIEVDDLRITRIPFDGGTTKNDLRMFGSFSDAGISFELEYDANLIDDAFIYQFWKLFVRCVDAIIHDEKMSVQTLVNSLRVNPEDKALLSEYNNTVRPGYADHTVHALIHQQTVQTPCATAIVCNGQSMSYEELEKRASSLALHLQAHGVKHGSQVGIIMPRSLELVVSMLAIMKAGACYVPADPIYPAERIEYMFENSQVACVLTIDNAYTSERFVCLDMCTLEQEILSDDVTLIDTVQPDDLIYVLYTSGSTGKPKGVMVKHGAVCNFIFGARDAISTAEEHRILATTTVCFDISVIELWRTLAFGGTIYLATDEERKDVAALKRLIVQNQINEINITPSQMSVFLLDSSIPAAWEYIKIIMIGGEAVPPSLLASMQKILPDTRIYNMYGPTETTIYSSIIDLTHEEEVSIGRPIANTRFYVVDSNMHVLPIGETGELCIAGSGLARGYMNRTDLTARQFVHLLEYDELVYKTGDLATLRSDLKMICHGRIDNQVKIRGYRIELEDVEQNILKTGLCEACTAFVIDSEHLGAIYTVSPDSPSDAAVILKELGKSVPQYMVPSKLVQVDSIPLNVNGKADRKKALALALEKHVPHNSVAEDAITDALLAIFRKVTLNDSICSTDQFFEAGGTSLGIFQVLAEIESVFGVALQYADIYKDMTAQNLARLIRQAKYKDNGEVALAPFCTVLNTVPHGRKVFAFPPIMGYGICFVHVAAALKESQLYAFDFVDDPARTDQYVSQISAIQADGPFDLFAFSAGAELAIEVANMLAAFSNVNLVLLDGFYNEIPKSQIDAAVQNFTIQAIDFIGQSAQDTLLLDTVSDKVRSYLQYVAEKQKDTIAPGISVHYICSDSITADILSTFRHRLGAHATYSHISGTHFDLLRNDFASESARVVEASFKPYLPCEQQDAPYEADILNKVLSIFKRTTLNDALKCEDDFFENGGTSLGVFQVLADIENIFGVSLSYADIYKHMTVTTLASKIKKELLKSNDNISSVSQIGEIPLEEALDLSNILFGTQWNEGGNAVLLTGANGFLGMHLMRSLLRLTDKTVLCLVRSEIRLQKAIEYYFGTGFAKQYSNRIIPIIGDITQQSLSQKADECINGYSVVHVYHTAADVRHFGSWDDSFRINTFGTKNVIEFCAKIGAKLHHVSTTGLSGIGLVEVYSEQKTFSEHDLDIGQSFSDNVYIHSKYLAEVLVHDAISRGLPAQIYRVGNLSERAYDGVHQMDEQGNAFLIRERSMKKLGIISDAFRHIQIEKTHIDKCAEAICKLSLAQSEMHTFHVFNPNTVDAYEYYTRRIPALVNVPDEIFMTRLSEHAKHDADCAVMKAYIDSMLKNAGASNIQVLCNDTLDTLDSVRFTWEERT